LKITKAGNEVLFAGRTVQLVKPSIAGETYQPYIKPEPKKTKKEEFDEGLFERLRELRKQIADSKGVPPYVVFSDVTLKEMAADHPINQVEMSLITGVGEYKLAEYGEVFIHIIQRFMATSEFGNSTVKGKTYLETLQLLQVGKTIAEIAKAREIHQTTVYSHLAYLFEKHLIHDIAKYLTREEMALIEKAVKAVGATEALKPIYDFLNEEVDYGKIRLYLSYKKTGSERSEF
jgi:ATP-dependent DNA helicase RecQ